MSFLKKHKNDILLVLALLVAAGALWIYTLLSREEGAEAVVTVAGEELCRLPLAEDAEMLIGEGEHTNLLIISGGEAYIAEASCPDGVCVRSGAVSFDGQTVVCLPHKLVLSIEGGADSGFDGVAG